MDTILTTAGLLALGTLTPGPNNVIVLRETALGGWRRAVPVMVGIVTGGLGLLTVVVAGSGSLPASDQRLATTMTMVACLLLAALGVSAVARSFGPSSHSSESRPGQPSHGFAGLFLFQFLNPKAWLVVVAAVASIGIPPPTVALAQLAALFVLIPSLSLALWSLAGAWATQHLQRPPVRAWFDRLTGGALVAFALLLLQAATDAP